MFPDYPQLKAEIKKRFELLTNQKSRSDPLLTLMQTIQIKEGDKMIYHTVEGEKIETSFTEFRSGFNLKNKDIIEKGVNSFIDVANNVGSDLQSQIGKKIFSDLDKITAKTGNVVDRKGEKFSPNMLLEAIEKMDLSFNDTGNPNMPAIFVSPEMGNRIQEKIPEWEKDEEHKKKLETLINKKRDEWNDRESNRKLVD
ncbi:MAG: hypothetical protein KAT05_16530 [Spirochaetes bacterium]|nr:hypothetical protein [Spirochaetota bacterium]